MKKRFGLPAAWLLATALAVGVASQAVGLVAERTIEVPIQVPVAIGGQSSIGPITVPPSEPTTPTTIAVTPSTTSTTAPATTASTSPGGTTSTTVVPPSTTTTTVPPATTTTTGPPSLDSRTFFLPGGQVSVACTGLDTITYLSAVPAPGWSLDPESTGPEKVEVEFSSGDEESEIEIVCRNGRLDEDISD
jgi:hypothetical protein